MAKLLINLQDDFDETALIYAVDHTEMVELLINAGADVNWRDRDGKTALMKALESGYANIAELLKNAGAVE